MGTTFRLPVAGLLAAIFLSACSAPAPPAPAPGASLQPLTAGALSAILTGSTLTQSGGPFWRRWVYAGVHRGDGTMTGRVSWSGGDEVAAGVWEIGPDDLYCRTWGNDWGAGQRGCFRVSGGGDTLVFDHATGSRGDADRYVYRLLPGNPHGL